MTHEEFIEQLAPIAVQLRLEGSPLFPSVRVAQNLLETGGTIHPWNNLGGIKLGNGKPNKYWRGQIVNKGTWEVYDGQRVDVTAAFRAYDSIYDFYKDQDLLLQNRRYERVRTAQTATEQADALVFAGYATDPLYAKKLKQLIVLHGLITYDMEVEAIMELREEVEELKQQMSVLQDRLSMPAIPDWATEAVQAAVDRGIVLSPEQRSFDYYSCLTVMYRLGLF